MCVYIYICSSGPRGLGPSLSLTTLRDVSLTCKPQARIMQLLRSACDRYLVLPLLHLPVVKVGHAMPTREQRFGICPLQVLQALLVDSRGNRSGRSVFPVGKRDYLKRGTTRARREGGWMVGFQVEAHPPGSSSNGGNEMEADWESTKRWRI